MISSASIEQVIETTTCPPGKQIPERKPIVFECVQLNGTRTVSVSIKSNSANRYHYNIYANTKYNGLVHTKCNRLAHTKYNRLVHTKCNRLAHTKYNRLVHTK